MTDLLFQTNSCRHQKQETNQANHSAGSCSRKLCTHQPAVPLPRPLLTGFSPFCLPSQQCSGLCRNPTPQAPSQKHTAPQENQPAQDQSHKLSFCSASTTFKHCPTL